jgi:adenylate cyclase
VAGRSPAEAGGRPPDLRPDLKFTELVASLLGALRDLQQLEQRSATLGRFFSPRALALLTGAEGELSLVPRPARVTVLFCDLRGFSAEAERSRDDLMGLLARVSRALDLMTDAIHAHQGVVGDFQGDAALAFWGWPLAEPDSAALACRAALAIRREFARAGEEPGNPLANFRCGIGLASGEAVAGRLGSAGRFKIDVFGPVVNLASRLEGITKLLRVPILIDEETVRQATAAGEPDWGRFRRLARVRPYGMAEAVAVAEVLPPADHPDVLSDEHLRLYGRALAAFDAGAWDDAYRLLHDLPHWDRGKEFLLSQILRHSRRAPSGWDGVVRLESK